MSQNINIRKWLYHLKYQYPTREIVVMFAIVLATAWFMWGSVQAMQKNYELKKRVDDKSRQAKLVELQTKMLEYKQNYLKSEEYQKLAAREYLGYGDPGEKLLILPANTTQAVAQDAKFDNAQKTADTVQKPSNMSQWMNFLFGGNVRES